MNPTLSETIYVDFITSSATGAAADADSTPTVEVFEDATDTAIVTPTATKRTGKTGDYRIPVVCTTGNGFEAGKSYNIVVSATVGGIAAKAVVARFQVRAKGTDDLATPTNITAGTMTTTTNVTNLPTAPSTFLDAIAMPTLSGPATTFPGRVNQLWRRFFKASEKEAAGGTITTYADDGTTPVTVQDYTDDGVGNETISAAS